MSEQPALLYCVLLCIHYWNLSKVWLLSGNLALSRDFKLLVIKNRVPGSGGTLFQGDVE